MSLFWKINAGYAVILIMLLGGSYWGVNTLFEKHHLQETTRELTGLAQTLALKAAAPDGISAAITFCATAAQATGARFTLIDIKGTVLADSDERPELMDNHAGRPEVGAALRGQVGSSTRFSNTVRANMMYMALPIRAGGDIIGAARAARPLTAIEQVLNESRRRNGIITFITAVIALCLSIYLARNFTRPLEDMSEAASRFGAGDFSASVSVPEDPDMAELAIDLNLMARQLSERIKTITSQSNQLQALLQSMNEGVFAVDRDEKILLTNAVAARLVGAEAKASQGRPLQETVRNHELQNLISKVLRLNQAESVEIIFYREKAESIILANAAPLRDNDRNTVGVVVILNDVTTLRQLETMRRDFVANVSHELRTPITALKGFVETLQEGAIDEPKTARKFLDIIGRHADRLHALTDDLLTLSRLEKQAELPLPMECVKLEPVLESAISFCSHKADEKKIQIKLDCDSDLELKVNSAVIEQAVINLLNNAITYSSPKSKVQINVGRTEKEVQIEVRDQGCGISSRDLPRIFERFYRVDQARSRAAGGTGLGLAIVKHAAQDHGGRVSVTSEIGKGSRFMIIMPL